MPYDSIILYNFVDNINCFVRNELIQAIFMVELYNFSILQKGKLYVRHNVFILFFYN